MGGSTARRWRWPCSTTQMRWPETRGLTHPDVRRVIEAAVAATEAGGAPAVVIEAIKLVESGLAAACDEVWLVTCDPASRGPGWPVVG